MSDIESSDSESIDSDSQVKHFLQSMLLFFYIIPTLPEISYVIIQCIHIHVLLVLSMPMARYIEPNRLIRV